MRHLHRPEQALPLHASSAARAIEQAALTEHPPFSLMARAGLASARWALALHPHAQRLWVAAGPGNNGGDGLVMARWWHQSGRPVVVTFHGQFERLPPDARRAWLEAESAGVPIQLEPPSWPPDLAVDALLGLGQRDAPQGAVLTGLRELQASQAKGTPLLALDLPTGLCADTGRRLTDGVSAQATLSLLTLKPGLFTGEGRDACGELWWDTLACEPQLNAQAPDAWLIGGDSARQPPRRHASHKGSFGDCWVIGGAPGMVGAAQLAARSALQAGAGRVYWCSLTPTDAHSGEAPELMHRQVGQLLDPNTADHATVVAGCGGGEAIAPHLPALLQLAGRLVLDADALNAVAHDRRLQEALSQRGRAGRPSVLTPHPLEAARLLGQSVAEIQSHRLDVARELADRYQAAVILKGSGSVVATPGATPAINPSGNARLASAGSGDVLAGWLGGTWSAITRQAEARTQDWPLLARLCQGATWRHGLAAELAPGDSRLPVIASQLIQAIAQAGP